jgi:hypothetical protein
MLIGVARFYQGRFAEAVGLLRDAEAQIGSPATGSEVNWVADSNCSVKDPNRMNFRILATTGGYVDDGTGNPRISFPSLPSS